MSISVNVTLVLEDVDTLQAVGITGASVSGALCVLLVTFLCLDMARRAIGGEPPKKIIIRCLLIYSAFANVAYYGIYAGKAKEVCDYCNVTPFSYMAHISAVASIHVAFCIFMSWWVDILEFHRQDRVRVHVALAGPFLIYIAATLATVFAILKNNLPSLFRGGSSVFKWSILFTSLCLLIVSAWFFWYSMKIQRRVRSIPHNRGSILTCKLTLVILVCTICFLMRSLALSALFYELEFIHDEDMSQSFVHTRQFAWFLISELLPHTGLTIVMGIMTRAQVRRAAPFHPPGRAHKRLLIPAQHSNAVSPHTSPHGHRHGATIPIADISQDRRGDHEETGETLEWASPRSYRYMGEDSWRQSSGIQSAMSRLDSGEREGEHGDDEVEEFIPHSYSDFETSI